MPMREVPFSSPDDLSAFVNAAEKVTVAAVVAGGADYAVGDLLTVLGGEGNSAVLEVAAEAGGVISSVTIKNEGAYTDIPANPVSVSGSGGATFNLTTASLFSGAADLKNITERDGQWWLGYEG